MDVLFGNGKLATFSSLAMHNRIRRDDVQLVHHDTASARRRHCYRLYSADFHDFCSLRRFERRNVLCTDGLRMFQLARSHLRGQALVFGIS